MSFIRLFRQAAAAAGSLALAASPIAFAAEAPVGQVIAVRNVATVQSPPQAARTAAIRTPVHRGDVLATGGDSAIRAQLADETFFSLGANARMVIDEFAYDTAESRSSLVLSFLRGAFRFVSGKPAHANPGQKAIRTPAASIGIRGTTVTGLVGPEALAAYRTIDPSYPQDSEEAETATLIILSDVGGEGGGIDVDSDSLVVPLRTAGQAIFFRRRGAAALPPRMVPRRIRARIERSASHRRLGREPGKTQQPGSQKRPNGGGLPGPGTGPGQGQGPGPGPGQMPGQRPQGPR